MAGFDPGAVYNSTLADIGLQQANEEASLGESDANLKANIGYQENQITQAEPGTYRANANAANRGGLLTSGINARRKDTIASNFAARRTANQLALTQGEARIQRERETGALNRERTLHGAQTTRAQEEDRIAKENPGSLPGSLTGGVVTKTTKTPGGSTYVSAGEAAQRRYEERFKGLKGY